MLAVSVFIVLSAFVDVLLTVLQHSIDQSGEPVCHGGDGFRGTELAAQASVLRAEVSLASQQGSGCDPQCRSSTVDHMPRASAQHFVPADTVVWAESQPRGEVRLGFPSAHVESHFTYQRLGDHHVDAVDPCQIHSGDALQFAAEMELGSILVLFGRLFLGFPAFACGGTVSAKRVRCFCNCWSHSTIRCW